ncbi:M23 family metallopeptidase [Catenulispora subtropica]|uniref:Peptidoglycan DD-metalloendopeptidase family protein n=1 Tax=Catenulispora subtropica TaxID=450798 RepID=A0ABP5BWH4_9ACTN
MRLIKILALAAVTAGLSLAIPALAHSGPRLPAAVPVAAAGKPGRHQTWTWPLVPPPGAAKPTVVRRFEPPAKRWQSGHRGVDLLGASGQEVLAAGAGTVSYAGVLFGRPVVAVDHTAPGRDTLRTTYEPVDPSVKVGDKVHVGELIGHLVDSAASHCAPRTCLHWGLVRGFGHAERYLDPSALLERGPVRLLPVWGMR